MLGVGGAILPSTSLAFAGLSDQKVKRLKSGARIALVSPASATDDEESLESARQEVMRWGWDPVLMPNAAGKMGYLGGSDEERATDLMAAFRDESIDGIWAIRGGYGCARILDRLDFELIRSNPKVLLGYSDITALLVAVQQECGLIGFHGPVATSSRSEFADNHLKTILNGDGVGTTWSVPEGEGRELELLYPGRASGRLIGGNLTILSSLCGTPWQLRARGKIVFLEEIGEAPYRVDRMLTQLLSSGSLKGAAGLLIGQFTGCDEKAPDSPWKVRDVLADRLKGLGVPVLLNCPIGHVKDKWTVPVGALCQMDADKKTAGLMEPAVF